MARMNRRARGVFGTTEKPRLAVYRSLRNIYAQIIDDTLGKTLVAVTTLPDKAHKNNVETAKKVGLALGKKAVAAGIKQVVFDRRERLYHGKVKALAEGAREAGLKF